MNTEFDQLLEQIDTAIAQRSDLRSAYPTDIRCGEFQYTHYGWQARATVIPGRKRRQTLIYGDCFPTAAEATADLLRSIPIWAQTLNSK